MTVYIGGGSAPGGRLSRGRTLIKRDERVEARETFVLIVSDALVSDENMGRRGGLKMLRKLGVVSAAIALLGLTISMISPAASDTRYEKRTIRVVELFADDEESTFKHVDLGKKGETVGDYFVYTDRLYNAKGTQDIGNFQAQFLITGVGETVQAEVDAWFVLPGGVITIEGPVEFGRRVETNAITGGTGKFKTAHGEARIVQKEDRTKFVFELLL
jgi:hypothetical protein